MDSKVYFASQAEKQDKETQKDKMDNIKEMGTIAVQEKGRNIHCLTVIGQIEGHMVLPPQNKTTKYEHVIPQLVAIEEDKNIGGLLLVLNTVGGDVEAGLAIAEMIASMSKPTVSLVLEGTQHWCSNGCINKLFLHCTIATMTIHPLRLSGMIIEFHRHMSILTECRNGLLNLYPKILELKEAFRKLMLKTGELANDVGTVLFGQEAVDYGIINEVGGLANALKKLGENIDKKEKETKGRELQ